jgi:hypothetical protein
MKIDTPVVATHLLPGPKSVLIPIGGFLRKSSLDELPQLWSILKGDKIPLFLPTRSDQYKAGPFDVNLTNTAIIIMGSSNITVAVRAKIRSNNLFI